MKTKIQNYSLVAILTANAVSKLKGVIMYKSISNILKPFYNMQLMSSDYSSILLRTSYELLH
jgi:hypothetical protein